MLTIAPLYLSLCALFFLFLSGRVIQTRRRLRIALGHENTPALLRPIRAQGNFVEYAPLFLLLLVVAEAQNANPILLHLLGSAFLFGRAAHAYSLLKAETYVDGRLTGPPLWRMGGMICTLSCTGTLALLVLFKALTTH